MHKTHRETCMTVFARHQKRDKTCFLTCLFLLLRSKTQVPTLQFHIKNMKSRHNWWHTTHAGLNICIRAATIREVTLAVSKTPDHVYLYSQYSYSSFFLRLLVNVTVSCTYLDKIEHCVQIASLDPSRLCTLYTSRLHTNPHHNTHSRTNIVPSHHVQDVLLWSLGT